MTFEDRGRVRDVGSNRGGASASRGIQLAGGSTMSLASNMTFMTGPLESSVQIATVIIDTSQIQSLMAFQGLQIYTGSAPMNDLLTSMLGASELILLGPAGQQVYGTLDYVASEAGQAAVAVLVGQGYTVPVVP